MKTKINFAKVILMLLLFCVGQAFSQSNSKKGPLDEKDNGVFKVKSKEEMAKNLKDLNGKGKAKFEEAKKELKKIKNPTFEIAPNEVLNKDREQLLGTNQTDKESREILRKQNLENKKNEKKILESLKELDVEGVSSFSFTDNSLIIRDYKLSPYLYCNWNKSILTPVRDQSSCGSCWAFAAASTFEHVYNKFYGSVSSPLDLSEQQLVSCGKTSSGVDAGSCSGGQTPRAFDYMKWNGITLEQYFPYTASNSSCRTNSSAVKAWTYGRYAPSGNFPSVSQIKSLVNSYGAVVTYMKAGISSFYSYGGGVYNGSPSDSSNSIDHAVTIVGWCDNLNAWIIKNSWGRNWGPYGGYAYVGYDQCNIGKYIYWVYPLKIQS